MSLSPVIQWINPHITILFRGNVVRIAKICHVTTRKSRDQANIFTILSFSIILWQMTFNV